MHHGASSEGDVKEDERNFLLAGREIASALFEDLLSELLFLLSSVCCRWAIDMPLAMWGDLFMQSIQVFFFLYYQLHKNIGVFTVPLQKPCSA